MIRHDHREQADGDAEIRDDEQRHCSEEWSRPSARHVNQRRNTVARGTGTRNSAFGQLNQRAAMAWIMIGVHKETAAIADRLVISGGLARMELWVRSAKNLKDGCIRVTSQSWRAAHP
jgi:hypothetical protein